VPDLRRYWLEVRTLERSLPEFVWLMGIEDPVRRLPGGGPVEVPAAGAARLLHEQSHRIATDAEITEHLAKEAAKKQRAIDDDMQRRGVAVVAMSGRVKKS
jgi:hypothetical protein